MSIPTVWRATVRAAGWFGYKIAAGATTLWQHTRSLLGKLGPTGNRNATSGTACRRLFVGVVAHPVTQALGEGVRSLAVLVRPRPGMKTAPDQR